MKLKKVLCMMLLSTLVLTSCGSENAVKGNGSKSEVESENTVAVIEESSEVVTEEANVQAASAVKLWEQKQLQMQMMFHYLPQEK